MEYATLGCGDLKISRLGLGCWAIGGHGWGKIDDRESIAAVHEALDHGINFFDTADCYGFGRSEELLSRALGARRHEVVIATKFGVRWDDSGRTWRDCTPKYLRAAVEASLGRLRLDTIPLCYVHWPDSKTSVKETMAALGDLVDEGKVGLVGLSNHRVEEIADALEVGPVAALQNRYSLIDREPAESLLRAAIGWGIPVIAWGALGQGLLTGKFDERSQFGADDHRSGDRDFVGERFRENLQVVGALGVLADELNMTLAQLAIRWALERAGIGSVLFGAKRPAQVVENVGACSWLLATEQITYLQEIVDRVRSTLTIDFFEPTELPQK